MNLRHGQSAKSFRNLISGDESRVGDIHSDEHLGCVRTCRNCGAASLRFEPGVLDVAVIHLDPQLHHVATNGIGYLRDSIRIGDNIVAGVQSQSRSREIWKWGVILALLFLLVEWFVYNKRVYV